MADKRSPGRAQRDAILAAVEQYHVDHDEWPDRRVVAKQLNVSLTNLRYHVDKLVEVGLVRRGTGGAIQVVKHGGEPIPPLATSILDELIYQAVMALEPDQPNGVPVTLIGLHVARQRVVLSRRCMHLVSTGKLRRIGVGYHTATPELEK